jgi:hypothetical protein
MIGTWKLHRYNDSIQAIDIANAGKRGKKCPRIHLGAWRDLDNSLQDSLLCLLIAQDPALRLNDEATSHLMNATPAEIVALLSGRIASRELQGHNASLSELRGVDVDPVNAIPVTIHTNLVHAEFTSSDYTVRDLVDHNNEPTLTHMGGKNSAKAAYAWAAANLANIREMSFAQIHEALAHAPGVSSVHYYCAMD